jgi:hypothetical protein
MGRYFKYCGDERTGSAGVSPASNQLKPQAGLIDLDFDLPAKGRIAKQVKPCRRDAGAPSVF